MNKTMAALNTVSLITLAGAGLAASYGPDGDKKFSEFSELDLNGEIQISKDEITLNAKTRFDRADQNRDRMLSAEEMTAEHTKARTAHQQDGQKNRFQQRRSSEL